MQRLHQRFVPAAAVAILALLIWWQWPLVADHDDELDVAIVSDAFVAEAEEPVSRRIREDGRTVQWFAGAMTWCEAPAAVERAAARDPGTIVVSFASADGCETTAVNAVIQAATGRRLVILAQPGRSGLEAAFASADADAGADVSVVDPTRLVGAVPEATTMGCQWWDTCPIEGVVAVRTPAGGLTEEGAERVARMVVAALR